MRCRFCWAPLVGSFWCRDCLRDQRVKAQQEQGGTDV